MFLSKVFLILAAVLVTAPAWSQEFSVRDSLGLSKLMWSERLQVVQGEAIDKGSATYSGYALSWDKYATSGRWGAGAGLLIGTGQASAGDFNGNVNFNETGPRGFTFFGFTPRGFYRATGQIQLGFLLPVLYRTVNWASSDSLISVQSRRSLSVAAAFEIRVLLNPSWEIVQNLGLLSTDAESFWQLGIQYRM